MLFKLFLMFAKLAAFSFGGGYAMIPIMLEELGKNHWATLADVADAITIATMCPGPVAVNVSVGVGYKIAGIPGVIVAFLGIAVPCAIIVIIVAVFFFKVSNSPKFKAALYGLRPMITGIIIYAAVKLALGNGMILAAEDKKIETGWNISIGSINIFEMKSLIIAAVSFIVLAKTKIHPIAVILVSGLIGYLIF